MRFASPATSEAGYGSCFRRRIVTREQRRSLIALKARLLERWPMTSLLDVFKEADLRIEFTDVFRSATAWENLDREIIQERLLLALYGPGSNAGIKRMSAGQGRTNYKDLLYIRRRYITKDQLRVAIREVVNATLQGSTYLKQYKIWMVVDETEGSSFSDEIKFALTSAEKRELNDTI